MTLHHFRTTNNTQNVAAFTFTSNVPGSYTVAAGTYTATELAAAITTAVNNAGVLVATYSAITGKFTFANPANIITITSATATLLGFPSTTLAAGTNTATKAPALGTNGQVAICINLGSRAIRKGYKYTKNGGTVAYTFLMPFTVNRGEDVQYFDPPGDMNCDFPQAVFQDVTVSLVDINTGTTLDNQYTEFEMELAFE
jgi:hypothetical protein